MSHTLYPGDCREVMRKLASEGFKCHAIVTDPPYELGFMGKKWDASGIAFDPEVWKLCLDLLLPGGHMLAFGGTRTHHRIWCAIEDAGFEVRDTLSWLYASGFPKSHNIALAIDKQNGHSDRGHRVATASRTHPDGTFEPNGEHLSAYEARSPEAKAWEGWGSAIKPAWEPICLARKPLDGTIASNVLKHGVGGLHVDACRIEVNSDDSAIGKVFTHRPSAIREGTVGFVTSQKDGDRSDAINLKGRFPANILLDESVAAEMDAKYGMSSSKPIKSHAESAQKVAMGQFNHINGSQSDSGGVSRYFYIAKANRAERDAGVDRCFHPTVKPVMLMRYLVRLVTPENGIVLDPFMGSGTTGIACEIEKMDFHGIEMNPEYLELAQKRIAAWRLHLDGATTETADPRQLELI